MPKCLSPFALAIATFALAGCSATDSTPKPAAAAPATSMDAAKRAEDTVPEGSSTAELKQRLGSPAEIRHYTAGKAQIEVWVYKHPVAAEWNALTDVGQSSGMYAGDAVSDPTKALRTIPAPSGGGSSYTRQRTITYDCVAFTIVDQKVIKIQRFQTQSQKTGYE